MTKYILQSSIKATRADSNLLISSNVHDSDTHHLGEGTGLARHTHMLVEVILGVDPDVVALLDLSHQRAGRHLLDVLLSIGAGWAFCLTRYEASSFGNGSAVGVSTTHAVFGVGSADYVVVAVDVED